MTPLALDLVPRTCWGKDLRWLLGESATAAWTQAAMHQTDGICAVSACGSPSVGIHTSWEYLVAGVPTRRLVRVDAVCADCTAVQHYGRTGIVDGPLAQRRARAHLARLRAWSDEQVWDHIQTSYRLWWLRSAVTWVSEVTACFTSTVRPADPTVYRRDPERPTPFWAGVEALGDDAAR